MRQLLFSLLTIIIASAAHGATRNVPAEYATIQEAILASVHHDTILVAPGVYHENINFRGKNIVVASRFVVDGNPAHIAQTVIDGGSPVHPDTASCVLIVSGEDSTAVLEGFTLTGGTGTVWTDIHYNSDYREGGGILIELSSPVVRHNLIVDNEAIDDAGVVSAGGGGIRCGDADPLITHNVIAGNRGRYGAGIVMNFCTGTISNNVICDNEGGEDYGGSGIWLYEVGPTVIEGNTVAGNHSEQGGGGLRVWSTSVAGRNNIIWGNTAVAGDAQIELNGGTTVTFTYSDIQGGRAGVGNIDLNPAFDAINLYLTASSPCVDVGDPASPPDPENPDAPGTAEYPAQGGLECDMGAYGGSPWPLLPAFTTPALSLGAMELMFDFVEPGNSDTVAAMVMSTGVGALVIDHVDISDEVSEVITVDCQFPLTIPPFSTTNVPVVWTPISDGPMFGTLAFFHNDPSTPNPTSVGVRIQQFAEVGEGPAVTDAGDSRGVNWVDYDDDSRLDLFVTNGPAGGQNNCLYHNDGDGAFSAVTGDPIVSDGASSVGSSWADCDNDGDIDAFVVNWYGQDNLLYANNGNGTFTQITEGPAVSDGGFSETCGWADYDGDALLDLFVANSGSDDAEVNFLYRGTGGGSLVRITEGDIATDMFHSRSVSWGDYDGDDDLDLFVANENNENNSLYRNEGSGSFTKITEGPLVTTHGKSFGSSWGDYDNDGDLDLFVANWGDQNNFLFRNDGSGTFARIMSGSVVNDHGWSIGSAWGDYDNDGDLDLFVSNGFSQDAGERLVDFLYANNGNGTFTRVITGPVAAHQGWGYGASWGDYDGDGDLDLYVARCFGHTEMNSLYRNTGTPNGWLEVRCEGRRANRSAIGAKVRAKAVISGQDVWQFREVSSQTGACGQSQLAVHFGLGDATAVDSLVIQWPRGGTEVFTDIPANQLLDITESAAGVHDDAPHAVRLAQNTPNPFDGKTAIHLDVFHAGTLSLRIFDLHGRQVRTLAGEPVVPGSYLYSWGGDDNDGKPLPAGTYLCRLDVAGTRATRVMTLLR